MYPVVSGLFVGLLVGLRHCLEPDHLAAVSTLVVRSRTRGAAAWLGVYWGVGHTLALVLVSGVLVAVGLTVPEQYEALFELGVGVMLFAMGTRSLWLAVRSHGPAAAHSHGSVAHHHAGPVGHVHLGDTVLAWRPLVVGLVHGVAGSGALTAAIMAELPGNAARVGYVVLFGIGSIVGMAVLSGLAGSAVARLARSPQVGRALSASAGAVALAIGVWWSARALAGI